MEVKLKDVIVKIKDDLTWGDANKINIARGIIESDSSTEERESKGVSELNKQGSETMKAMMKMMVENNVEAKYVLAECAISSIKKGEENIEFTRDWMDNLSIQDGNKLSKSLDELAKKNQI